MGYVSTGMGYHFSALLVFLMALHLRWGTETPFGLVLYGLTITGEFILSQLISRVAVTLVRPWIVDTLLTAGFDVTQVIH